MNTISEIINSGIIEIYEREEPGLCKAIKALAFAGANYTDFDQFARRTLGKQYKLSITYPASLTLFRYYKNIRP
jgi:hypothetical protein